MRHVLNRSDFEDLYGPQSYPKRTRAAAAELVTRGLKASAGTLDHLASKGIVAVPQNDAGRRLWERRHIDQAAKHLDEIESFTPRTWQHVLEDTHPAQDLRAFREACRHTPDLPPDPTYFVRIVTPGVPGLGIYAMVHYRPMSPLELAEWHRLIERAEGRAVAA